jgi:hypothetical protein
VLAQCFIERKGFDWVRLLRFSAAGALIHGAFAPSPLATRSRVPCSLPLPCSPPPAPARPLAWALLYPAGRAGTIFPATRARRPCMPALAESPHPRSPCGAASACSDTVRRERAACCSSSCSCFCSCALALPLNRKLS